MQSMTTLVKQSSASAFTLTEQHAWTRSATLFEQNSGLYPRKLKGLKRAKHLHQFHFNMGQLDIIGTHFIIRNTSFDKPVVMPVTESYYTDNFDPSVKLIQSKIFKVKGRVTKIKRFEPQVSLD
jgi:hypothetical protein